MARYTMDCGSVVDTEKATRKWSEDRKWAGENSISVATGSEWDSQTLYRSRKGRYYLEHTSRRTWMTPHASWCSKPQAAAWLLANGHDIPEDLRDAAEQVAE